jgi:hypothetical protein
MRNIPLFLAFVLVLVCAGNASADALASPLAIWSSTMYAPASTILR